MSNLLQSRVSSAIKQGIVNRDKEEARAKRNSVAVTPPTFAHKPGHKTYTVDVPDCVASVIDKCLSDQSISQDDLFTAAVSKALIEMKVPMTMVEKLSIMTVMAGMLERIEESCQ